MKLWLVTQAQNGHFYIWQDEKDHEDSDSEAAITAFLEDFFGKDCKNRDARFRALFSILPLVSRRNVSEIVVNHSIQLRIEPK